jgi:hypothetical protein
MNRTMCRAINRSASVTLVFLIAAVLGCAALTPRPEVYRNDALNRVFWADEKFAAELAKIPGVNTPASPFTAAVTAAWSDYRSGGYKDAFDRVLATGIPDARAYCAPLEALLWLYARDPGSAREILSAYDPEALLAASWGECTGDRWDEWEEVRARLSAPGLCVYYTKKALRYIPERNDGKNYLQSPYETILMKGGDCEDFAALIVEALEYGGWYARLFTVDIMRDPKRLPDSHTVACFRDDGRWYFIQGYDGTYLGGDVTGPFAQAGEMADFIAASVGGETYYFYIHTVLEFIEAYRPLSRKSP